MAPQKIRVPKPAAGSYDKNRPLEKNTLILNQVRLFRQLEEKLPPESQTGIPYESIKTEGQAAEYIRRMTMIFHPKTAKSGVVN